MAARRRMVGSTILGSMFVWLLPSGLAPGSEAYSFDNPWIGPGFPIDTTTAYGPKQWSQEHPAIAFDGSNYLVVWEDVWPPTVRSIEIHAARVSPSGAVIDHLPIPVSTAPRTKHHPSVAFDGANYLVVWLDYRNGGSPDIYGARVSPSGNVLDPDGIAISTAPGSQVDPSVVFGDSSYLVVWYDWRNGPSDIYGSRVTPSGVVLDTAGIMISADSGCQKQPAVSFDGADYFVVWDDERLGTTDIYGARVTQGGTVIDTSGIAICTAVSGQYNPAVSFNDTDYLVAWWDVRNGDSDVYGARVTTGGVVLDTSGIAISTVPGAQGSPRIASAGSDFLVVWRDSRNWTYDLGDIYGARVTSEGNVYPPEGIPICYTSGPQTLPAVANDGANSLVVWQDRRSGGDDICGSRVDSAGAVLDPNGILISTDINCQYSTSASFDGTNYLVVWEDNRGDPFTDICGALVSPTGTVLGDPLGVAIAPLHQAHPDIASDGMNYLVVWEDNRNGFYDIFGTRITPSGTVLDPWGIVVSDALYDQVRPSVAFNGTDYLVVWEDCRASHREKIYGARVSPNGAVLDPEGIPIATDDGYHVRPAVGSGGDTCLVVWGDSRGPRIWGSRVTASGIVVDTLGAPISPGISSEGKPAIAFDGVNYFVVWSDFRNVFPDIYGTRVTPSLEILDPLGVAIVLAPVDQELPSIAFDGSNYVVAWQDERDLEGDIYVTRVSPEGVVLDPNGTAVLDTLHRQQTPDVACGPSGEGLIVYSNCISGVHHPYRAYGAIFLETGVAEEPTVDFPSVARLTQNWPNPFAQQTNISFWLSIPSHSSLRIYDMSGRLIRTLVDDDKQPGRYTLTWDGRNEAGRKVAAGVYFCYFRAAGFKQTRKIVLMR